MFLNLFKLNRTLTTRDLLLVKNSRASGVKLL